MTFDLEAVKHGQWDSRVRESTVWEDRCTSCSVPPLLNLIVAVIIGELSVFPDAVQNLSLSLVLMVRVRPTVMYMKTSSGRVVGAEFGSTSPSAALCISTVVGYLSAALGTLRVCD